MTDGILSKTEETWEIRHTEHAGLLQITTFKTGKQAFAWANKRFPDKSHYTAIRVIREIFSK